MKQRPIESEEEIFFPPQGSVNLHEDEDEPDDEFYDPLKDPTVEQEEKDPIPF